MTQNDIDYASRVFTERAVHILKNHIKKIIMYGSCARSNYLFNRIYKPILVFVSVFSYIDDI